MSNIMYLFFTQDNQEGCWVSMESRGRSAVSLLEACPLTRSERVPPMTQHSTLLPAVTITQGPLHFPSHNDEHVGIVLHIVAKHRTVGRDHSSPLRR